MHHYLCWIVLMMAIFCHSLSCTLIEIIIDFHRVNFTINLRKLSQTYNFITKPGQFVHSSGLPGPDRCRNITATLLQTRKIKSLNCFILTR